jgi:D-3-phosphoglycerate dehydrogenase
MAHVGRNLFKRVVACDPYIIDGDFPAFVERRSLEPLFAECDVVSLHVPLNAETRGMIGAEVLSDAKPGSFLVNTARGAVVDVDAALAALDAGRLAGLGLDVLPTEPVPASSRLLGHPASDPDAARGILLDRVRARAAAQVGAEYRHVVEDRAAGLRRDRRNAPAFGPGTINRMRKA